MICCFWYSNQDCSVSLDGALYVRAHDRQNPVGYMAAMRQRQAGSFASMTKEVSFESVDGVNDHIDDTYRAKYKGSIHQPPGALLPVGGGGHIGHADERAKQVEWVEGSCVCRRS